MREQNQSQDNPGLGNTYISNLKSMLIDNIKLEARNIHIRIEDNGVSQENKFFSMGGYLKSFKLYSTDENFKETFIRD